jgi:hypothetical protein
MTTFTTGEKISIKEAEFVVIKVRGGNMTVRATGGFTEEGDTMTLKNPTKVAEAPHQADKWDENWTLQELRDWAEANGNPVPYYITRKGDVIEFLNGLEAQE